jgi:xanthosine utilization system XapX-like protein
MEAKMKTYFLSKIVALSAAILLSLSAVSAQAAPLIDFIGLLGGTITDNTGSGGGYVGTNINVSAVQLIDTALNEGTHDVQNGLLNFDTEADTITITGAVADLGIGQTTLLSGSFTSFSFGAIPGSTTFAFVAAGPDTKSPALVEAAGLAAGTEFTFAGFINSRRVGTTNVYNVFSSDVGNTPVPEPSSLLLLGSGLVALGLAARRKKA